jgi:hypothetical protein
MSKAIEALLAECEDLLSRHEVSRAYDNLVEVIRNGSKQDLDRLEGALGEIIGRFMHKRRRDLTHALQLRMNGGTYASSSNVGQPSSPAPHQSPNSIEAFNQDVGDRLDALSRYHIFQWSTYYRDELRAILADTVDLIRTYESANEAFELLRTQSCRHSKEIFSKGYSFVSSQTWMTPEQAEGKSLAGLRSFLELPVELYADESARLTTPQDCRVLRRATSRIICGVLQGFASSSLGTAPPALLLQRTIKSWARVLPLLEEQDIIELDQELDLGSLSPVLGEPLHVLARALDEASRMSSVDPMVVRSASVSLDDRVMDLALRPPADSSDTKPLEIAILAGDLHVVRHQVEQRAKLGYIACVTPKLAVTYFGGKIVPGSIADMVVPIDAATPDFLLQRMRQRFYENKIVVPHGSPLKTNIAERFPLENPTLLTFFRVQRQSIRALETMLSTRTGVLLWCSVRRSGKTTGVSELASAIQERSAVFQRCELTGLDHESRVLFEAVCDALSSADPLPRDFVRKVVAQAAPMGVAPSRGSILILDEYDRLFGRLRAAGRRNEDVRHLVVQPLLDQLVEFATDNLLILLGQQPNAHYIVMDQNQLSAYVQQEPYPLFSHSPNSTQDEFWDLLGKVFQQTLRFEASFANAVYAETGGHPFLTVNLLRELVDWLIERRTIPSEVMLTRELFNEFSAIRLDSRAVSTSKHYEYFREAAAEALSPDGAAETPWIHAAYDLLRLLGSSGTGAQLSVERRLVERAVEATLQRVRLTNFTCQSFIASAARGNFVDTHNDIVFAKIPILARIAASTRRL